MISTADLKSHTKADLSKMAKRLGVSGFSQMVKDDLVKAVAKASRAQSKSRGRTTAKTKTTASASKTRVNGNGSSAKNRPSTRKSTTAAKRVTNGSKQSTVSDKSTTPKRLVRGKANKPKAKPTSPRVLKRIRELQLQKESSKDISFQPTLVKPPGATEPIWEKEPQLDRVALFVRDAYWMHASWDITRGAVERAKAALSEHWHSAKPVLRLLKLDETGTSETVERDIEIHGGLRNWYVDWKGGSASFRVMVGYVAPNERFHCICESNVVRMPDLGSSEEVDQHWSDLGGDAEKLFAMSGGYESEHETQELKTILEDRVGRELGAPALAKLGASAQSPFKKEVGFHFDMDVELVVYGSTVADGYLTLNGEPVGLRDDGTFSLRLPFPDRRQVLPAVACSRDGSQERMIVVAVERNTKVMEPVEKDPGSAD